MTLIFAGTIIIVVTLFLVLEYVRNTRGGGDA